MEKEIELEAMGMPFYGVIMDSTHIKFRTKSSEKYGIPLHIMQVNKQFLNQLREKGFLDKMNNGFITIKNG